MPSPLPFQIREISALRTYPNTFFKEVEVYGKENDGKEYKNDYSTVYIDVRGAEEPIAKAVYHINNRVNL